MSCVCKRAAAVQASLPFLFRLTAKCHHGLPGPYVPCAYRQDDDGPARVLGRLFLLMLQDRTCGGGQSQRQRQERFL